MNLFVAGEYLFCRSKKQANFDKYVSFHLYWTRLSLLIESVLSLLIQFLQIVKTCSDDLDRLFNLLLGDHEGWGQANRGVVSGFGQQAMLRQDLCEVVSVHPKV